MAEDDPELLTSVDRIYYAAWLIRQHQSIIADDFMLWGNLAETLEHAAGIPRRTLTPMPWREFNRTADLATGVIRRYGPDREIQAKLLRWVMQLGTTP